MVYATGGLAYGRVSVSGSFSDSDCISSAVTACMWGFNRSATNVGWTGGGGVQGAVPSIPNWTWKIEYLHVDLGSISGSGFDSDFGGPFFYNAKFTDNILRFGLNWNLH
jgi:outer membrane immunogenic protein